jgi:hypothetical protein
MSGFFMWKTFIWIVLLLYIHLLYKQTQMQVVRLTSGIIAHRLTKSEQEQVWAEIAKPVYSDSTPFYTPNDNLKYYVLNSQQNGYTCIDTISANGKTIKVKADVCKLDTKIMQAVRKAYGK